jgi:hypothetical protein
MKVQHYFSAVKNEAETESVSKGRSKALLNRRDNKLVARFYYYAIIRKLNYRDTIAALVQEFDICDRVVLDRLRHNQSFVDELFAHKPSVTELRKRFPYLRW